MAHLRDSMDAIRDRLAVLGSGRTIVRVFAGLFLLPSALLCRRRGLGAQDRRRSRPSLPPTCRRAAAGLWRWRRRWSSARSTPIGWTANDPFFLPGAVLDNMPNYQQGIIYALSRFGNALDRAARALARHVGGRSGRRPGGRPAALSRQRLAVRLRYVAGAHRVVRKPIPGRLSRPARLQPAGRRRHRHLRAARRQPDRHAGAVRQRPGVGIGGDRRASARQRRLPDQLQRRRHLLSDQGTAIRLLHAAEGARSGLRAGVERTQPRHGVDADADRARRKRPSSSPGWCSTAAPPASSCRATWRARASCCSACAPSCARSRTYCRSRVNAYERGA